VECEQTINNWQSRQFGLYTVATMGEDHQWHVSCRIRGLFIVVWVMGVVASSVDVISFGQKEFKW